MITKPLILPYLFFGGRTEEAIKFYTTALGAQPGMLMRFKDSPDQAPADCGPINPEGVMHAEIKIGDNTIMMSDGCGEETKFGGFSLSISAPTEAEAKRYFDALAQGGKVEMPLTKTFWSPCFGMLTDKFGVGWMVNVPGPQPA